MSLIVTLLCDLPKPVQLGNLVSIYLIVDWWSDSQRLRARRVRIWSNPEITSTEPLCKTDVSTSGETMLSVLERYCNGSSPNAITPEVVDVWYKSATFRAR